MLYRSSDPRADPSRSPPLANLLGISCGTSGLLRTCRSSASDHDLARILPYRKTFEGTLACCLFWLMAKGTRDRRPGIRRVFTGDQHWQLSRYSLDTTCGTDHTGLRSPTPIA